MHTNLSREVRASVWHFQEGLRGLVGFSAVCANFGGKLGRARQVGHQFNRLPQIKVGNLLPLHHETLSNAFAQLNMVLIHDYKVERYKLIFILTKPESLICIIQHISLPIHLPQSKKYTFPLILPIIQFYPYPICPVYLI